MKFDRTKNYGFTLEEYYEMKRLGKPYLNIKADFDDWFTEEEIKELFPNQTLIVRIKSRENETDFSKAQIIYYQCDGNFALEKFWELEDNEDENYTYFRYHTLDPVIYSSCCGVIDDISSIEECESSNII